MLSDNEPPALGGEQTVEARNEAFPPCLLAQRAPRLEACYAARLNWEHGWGI